VIYNAIATAKKNIFSGIILKYSFVNSIHLKSDGSDVVSFYRGVIF
jgi:hypothetical protein